MENMCDEITGRLMYTANGEGEPVVVGSLTALRFNRDRNFYMNADITADAMEMATSCFNAIGRMKPLFASIALPSASHGGLVYLDEVCVQSEHRGNDIGLHFAVALLRYLPDWTLCVQTPFVKDAIWKERTHEELLEYDQVRAKIARHFARVGFHQIPGKSKAKEFWFLERERMLKQPVANKASVRDLVVIQDVRKPPLPAKTDADQAIHDLIQNSKAQLFQPVNIFITKVTEQISNGGKLDRVNALHCLAAMDAPLIVFLAICALGADINHVDPANGCTPLHIASMKQNKELVQYLLGLGAKKNCENDKGQTPLDSMIDTIDEMNGFKELLAQMTGRVGAGGAGLVGGMLTGMDRTDNVTRELREMLS
jgi:hypothetical protein